MLHDAIRAVRIAVLPVACALGLTLGTASAQVETVRTRVKRTRRLLAAALLAGLCLSSQTRANSTDDAVTWANKMAYQTTLKCYVILAYASDERRKAGDENKSALYESKARRSFDLSFAAGRRIGLNDDQVDRDLDFTQSTELPRLVRDRQYFLSSAATCKAVGLL